MEHPTRKRAVPTSYGATVVLESYVFMAGRLSEGGRPLFPLFLDNGAASLSGRLWCLTCHDPHAGPTLNEGRAAYLRDPEGAFLSELCVACHREDAAQRVRRFHVLPRKQD